MIRRRVPPILLIAAAALLMLPFLRGPSEIAQQALAQTRQTADNKELQYSYTDSSESPVQGAYTIWLTLSGKKAPDAILP